MRTNEPRVRVLVSGWKMCNDIEDAIHNEEDLQAWCLLEESEN